MKIVFQYIIALACFSLVLIFETLSKRQHFSASASQLLVASYDDSGLICRPNACGFSPMMAAAKKRGT